MSIETLHLSDLRSLDENERNRRLLAFAALRNQPPNGEIQFLNERIAEFESRYEMDSATMVDRVSKQPALETADICTWLILLDAKNALVAQTG